MGQKYLIDTNVIIDYTSNLLSEKGNAFAEQILNSSFTISVIVKIETLGFLGEPAKIRLLESFFRYCCNFICR